MGSMCSAGPAAHSIVETSNQHFEAFYELGEKLGEGEHCVVRKGAHKTTNRQYAIKIILRYKLCQRLEEDAQEEISILKELNHEHIIHLYEVFKDPKHYYLVTELLQGGDLFDGIFSKANNYNEKEARNVCKILLTAVAYIHSKGIAHRDLKPENLLMMSTSNDATIKIADFGFARRVSSNAPLITLCGTPGYLAPEILDGVPYDTKVDIWSLGVIIYIILGGYPPFNEKDQSELFRKIRSGKYEFHDEYWGTISKDAKDLISSLLTVNPQLRHSAAQALQSHWVNERDEVLESSDLGINLKEMKKYFC